MIELKVNELYRTRNGSVVKVVYIFRDFPDIVIGYRMQIVQSDNVMILGQMYLIDAGFVCQESYGLDVIAETNNYSLPKRKNKSLQPNFSLLDVYEV